MFLSQLNPHKNVMTYLGMWLDVYVQSIVISFISVFGSTLSVLCGLVLMVVVSFSIHVLIPLRLLMFQFYSFFLINVETNNKLTCCNRGASLSLGYFTYFIKEHRTCCINMCTHVLKFLCPEVPFEPPVSSSIIPSLQFLIFCHPDDCMTVLS